MKLTLHKIALILLTTLSMASASENNTPVDQSEFTMQEKNKRQELRDFVLALIKQRAQLTAEIAELKQYIEEQHYNHLYEIDALEKKLSALQEAYEQSLHENEELQTELEDALQKK